jgi:putative ABC transport system permease protein
MVACFSCVVALLLDLGLFIDQSGREMTARALQSLTTDLQIERASGSNEATVTKAITDAAPKAVVASVGYASIDAFEFSSRDSTQTTGAGKAVGVSAGYFEPRANDLRILSGDLSGAVLLQQTAANLHAQPGDVVTMKRSGFEDTKVPITGIIDLKTADTFFQAVGAPAGTGPTAPPDNAVLMPMPEWQQLFGAPSVHPAIGTSVQLHVLLDRSTLPANPNDAYLYVTELGRSIEARLAGTAVLANNLAAQLDAARGDALYARVLFLFLGAPGAVLAGLLALTIARSARSTRARDQELLRRRGATPGQRFWLLVAEGLLIGALGAIAGALLGGLLASWLGAGLAHGAPQWPWIAGACLLAIVLAPLSLLIGSSVLRSPQFTVTAQEAAAGELRRSAPLWQRLYLDCGGLAVAGLVFWKTAAGGYQIVLATEGVAATSVDYTAFLAPLLLWIGGGLLVVRFTEAALRVGRPLLRGTLDALVGPLSSSIAAALAWQRHRIALTSALVALAVAFLVSTAIFNATYEAQSRVDAELTNGADVTVTGTPASPAGAYLKTLRGLAGVAAAEPMQHRFAYVGTDLQDLYGIDPQELAKATDLSNAYFANGDAKATMKALSQRPNAVLVSEETVTDFQLQIGDTINLRLQGEDKAYHVVPFIFAGVVREFPTAPHDSFLVANASYVASRTGLSSNEVVLMHASGGGDADTLKAEVERALSGTALQISSLPDAVRTIGTSLTAVDLRGLSGIELAFGLVLAVGATGLNLALGFADRQRDFALLSALGADRRKLGAFVWSETLVVACVGILGGALLGGAVAEMLVVVLQGVFDPPPQTANVPWLYLAIATAVLATSIALAVLNAVWRAASAPASRLRELR